MIWSQTITTFEKSFWLMPRFKRPRLVQTEQQVVYHNIILDTDFCYYSYQNPVPVFLGTGLHQQVGEAYLAKVGHTLYGELRLNKNSDYTHLYPFLPFDLDGRLTALLLSPFPEQDEGVPSLSKQVETLYP